jgi:hypothetical protein
MGVSFCTCWVGLGGLLLNIHGFIITFFNEIRWAQFGGAVLGQFWVPVSGPFWTNSGGQVFDACGSDFGGSCGPVSGARLIFNTSGLVLGQCWAGVHFLASFGVSFGANLGGQLWGFDFCESLMALLGQAGAQLRAPRHFCGAPAG